MAHENFDIAAERTTLDRLATRAMWAGAILAGFGLLATFLLYQLPDLGGTPAESGDGMSHSGAAVEPGGSGHAEDGHATEGHGEHHFTGHNSEWSIYHPYLVSAAFYLTITLGALFFVIIHHLTRAGWSTVLRRLAEGTTQNLFLMVIIFVPIVLTDGATHLYKWMDYDPADTLISGKAAYLNHTAFLIRMLVYFTIWIGLSVAFHRLSVQQDESGDPRLSRIMGRLTPVAILLFALTVSFAGFDLLMSLDAHWFSTMFGVYIFAGCVLSFHSFLALLTIWLQRNGRLEKVISSDHLQDVGKMIFAFTVFWAYIAFSQYMLYWYGNIPEETSWYLRRQEIFGWGAWGLFLIFGHFVVPFLFLLSRHVKRRRATLAVGAGWMLAVHWCDMYYLVMPQVNDGLEFPFRMVDVTIFLAMGGVYLASTAFFLRKHSLVAIRDPKLPEALAFHNV